MTHNHLRRYRKRGALTQEEMAFLLGIGCGTQVSRHERSARAPSLQTALAYQAIFGVPVHELYPGEFQQAITAVGGRARQLLEDTQRRVSATQAPFKGDFLSSLGAEKDRVSPSQHAKQQY